MGQRVLAPQIPSYREELAAWLVLCLGLIRFVQIVAERQAAQAVADERSRIYREQLRAEREDLAGFRQAQAERQAPGEEPS